MKKFKVIALSFLLMIPLLFTSCSKAPDAEIKMNIGKMEDYVEVENKEDELKSLFSKVEAKDSKTIRAQGSLQTTDMELNIKAIMNYRKTEDSAIPEISAVVENKDSSKGDAKSSLYLKDKMMALSSSKKFSEEINSNQVKLNDASKIDHYEDIPSFLQYKNLIAQMKEKINNNGFISSETPTTDVVKFYTNNKGRTKRFMLKTLDKDNVEKEIIVFIFEKDKLNQMYFKGEFLGADLQVNIELSNDGIKFPNFKKFKEVNNDQFKICLENMF